MSLKIVGEEAEEEKTMPIESSKRANNDSSAYELEKLGAESGYSDTSTNVLELDRHEKKRDRKAKEKANDAIKRAADSQVQHSLDPNEPSQKQPTQSNSRSSLKG